MHSKKHIISAVCFVLFAIIVASCSENTESITNYNNWEARNTAYFTQKYKEAQDSINAGSKNWKLLKSIYKDSSSSAMTDYVIAHIIQCSHADGTQKALITDSVYVHYRGWLIPRDEYVQDTTTYAVEGVMFDTSFYGDELNVQTAIPSKFLVSALVDGFQTALVNMHVGDRMEVIIPYTMGYGSSSSSTSVPNYSTLRFDILLTYIGRPGTKMPNVQ